MKSVRVLMDHIIDYAGLFPPARLDMPAAVRRYAEYLKSDSSWMLGRFIVPCSQLEEFESVAESFLSDSEGDDAAFWSLSALTAAAEEIEQFERDLAAIEQFNATHSDPEHGLAVIETIELRAASSRAIESAADLLPEELDAFFELPLARDVRGMIAAIAGVAQCAKARTGGITPDLFPAADHLARFIVNCAAAEVPFKATAGLHHPFTHPSRTVLGATEYGFVNVFIGAALALHDTDDIDEATLAALLNEQDAAAFTFDDASVVWRDWRVDTDDLIAARLAFALSYGSCSFEEPRDELRELKLLT